MHAEYLKAMGVNLINPLTSVALHGSHAKAKLSPKNQQQPSGTAVSNFANSLIPSGKTLFNCISPNIEDEEKAIVEDNSTMQDESISQVSFCSVTCHISFWAISTVAIPTAQPFQPIEFSTVRNFDHLN